MLARCPSRHQRFASSKALTWIMKAFWTLLFKVFSLDGDSNSLYRVIYIRLDYILRISSRSFSASYSQKLKTDS